MCDLSDEESIKSVPLWINEISERSNTRDHVIMVMANKCDLIDSIDQAIVVSLENELECSYPEVIYHETSVLLNLDVHISLQHFADLLKSNKQSYALQKLD